MGQKGLIRICRKNLREKFCQIRCPGFFKRSDKGHTCRVAAKNSVQMNRIIKISVQYMSLLGFVGALQAQTILSEKAAIALALQNHPAVQASELEVKRQQTLRGAAASWDPAQIYQNTTADPDLGMFGTVALGIQQNFPSARQTAATRARFDRLAQVAQARGKLTRREITRQVREIYQHLSYLNSKTMLLNRLDSLYNRTAAMGAERYQRGDADLAEKLSIENQAQRIRLEKETVGHEIAFDQVVLGQLLGLGGSVQPLVEPLQYRSFSLADTALLSRSARALVSSSLVDLARADEYMERSKKRPTISAAAYGQYLANGLVYPGWQVGVNVPLARKSLQKQVEAAALATNTAEAEYRNQLLNQASEMAHLLHEQEKYDILIAYYNEKGRVLSAELLRNAELNYRLGERDYTDFVRAANQAAGIEMEYLENLYQLNLTVLALQAITEQ